MTEAGQGAGELVSTSLHFELIQRADHWRVCAKTDTGLRVGVIETASEQMRQYWQGFLPVYLVHVRPAWRGRGIGLALYQELLTRVPARGLVSVAHLRTNTGPHCHWLQRHFPSGKFHGEHFFIPGHLDVAGFCETG